MLFILAIDPLHKMIETAATRGLLQPILPRAAKLRCSLYADDAAIFANPDRMELYNINTILKIFGDCSGLHVNLNKTEIFPIRCSDELISEALSDFPGKICKFPGKYLGLPLHTRKLRRIEFQPLLDKIEGRLQGWKGKLMSLAGRETLVKCVLTAQPIYHLTVFQAHKWLIAQIDRMRRSFLWKGRNRRRLVAVTVWLTGQRLARPGPLGGLVSWTWNDWRELYVFVGTGTNGKMMADHGQGWTSQLIRLTKRCLMHRHLSR
jgi:hypothetical protein